MRVGDRLHQEPEEEGWFGALTSFCNFELNNYSTGDGRCVQMAFDSGASTTTFPPEIGEGYDLIKDEYVDYQFRGAGAWRRSNQGHGPQGH